MKRDLDRLMEARGLDAVVVSGKVHGNPPLYYLLNGAKLTQAVIVKKRGEEPVLVANPMEREEAEVAGYPIRLAIRYEYGALLRQYEGDVLAATVAYYLRVLEDLEIGGNVGMYGQADQGAAYVFMRALAEAASGITILGEYGTNLIQVARTTKDAGEVERIRDVGRRVIEVVDETVRFLQGHAVDDAETLRRADGGVLTVGDVHAHIHRLVALQGLEDPEGFIFATGRDAGIPHSKGNLASPMRLGESIVFDIFPCEAGGGYFFDMTRTFALGYAPEPLERIHRDVYDCLERVKAAVAVGEEARSYQQMTCAFFAERGHPTVAEDPATLNGYVHTLGHGLGLELHETPRFSDVPANDTTFTPGHVFTMEPGLYYPDEGMGCRLEDVIWIDATGNPHNLTSYPYELVIPMT